MVHVVPSIAGGVRSSCMLDLSGCRGKWGGHEMHTVRNVGKKAKSCSFTFTR